MAYTPPDPSNVQLIFWDKDPVTPDLVFGKEEGGGEVPWVELQFDGAFPQLQVSLRTIPTAEIQVSGAFPSLTVSTLLVPSVKATLTVALPAMGVATKAVYDPRVERPTVHHSTNRYQLADKVQNGPQVLHDDAGRLEAGSVSAMVKGEHTSAGPSIFFHALTDTRARTDGRYQQAAKVRQSYGHSFFDLIRTQRPKVEVVYQAGAPVRQVRLSKFGDLLRSHDKGKVQRYQDGVPKEKGYFSKFHVADVIELGYLARFQEAVPPPPGFAPWKPAFPPGTKVCYIPNANLLFKDAALDTTSALVFVCDFASPVDPSHPPQTTIIVPVKRAYVVFNEVQLFTVGTPNVELPVTSLTLDIDMDSWAWGFSATVDAKAWDKATDPTGVSILYARIKGTDYLVLAENVTRGRGFGKKQVSLTGRGVSALLDEPYNGRQVFSSDQPATAQQLLNQALTSNGVSIGWEVEWNIDDWLVPAGTWAMTGTYKDVVTSIAAAAGAFVYPYPDQQKLAIKPRYPVLPWEWKDTAPEVLIPSAAVESESIKWAEYPSYNAVYVSGTANGILGLVRKTGTAGDVLAPMETNDLVTSQEVARMLGGSILAKTGKIATLNLTLPVLDETGIIKPGMLIKYVADSEEYMGVVTKTQIGMQSYPSLRQTIEVEAHL